jgi:glycosyltransferase involved in cell wall biosynthesis
MPVYNDAAYVRQAVESILAQTFRHFELVAVDDGSTDETGAILAEFAAADPRVRIITHPTNMGTVASLNDGLAACRCDLVARMDSDDIALPTRLQRQVDFMREHPQVAASGTSLRYIDATGRDLGVVRRCNVAGSLLQACPLLHPTVILRHEVMEAHGLAYRERFRHGEDYYLWLELSRHGQLAAIDDVLLQYRIRAGATRMRHLKAMLWATVRAKLAGIFHLGIRPTVSDVFRLAAEIALLAVPSAIVRRMYLRRTFGPSARPQL